MACFDHFSILISQMVLPAFEDHDTVDAESRSRCRRIRMLARQKLIVGTVQFGPDAPFFPGLSCG
jgi:hypothetical protein